MTSSNRHVTSRDRYVVHFEDQTSDLKWDSIVMTGPTKTMTALYDTLESQAYAARRAESDLENLMEKLADLVREWRHITER